MNIWDRNQNGKGEYREEDSVVNSNGYACRGSRFGSLHPDVYSQASVFQFQGIQYLFLISTGTMLTVVDINMHSNKARIISKF